MAGFSLNESPL